jgi:hypothetical protein
MFLLVKLDTLAVRIGIMCKNIRFTMITMTKMDIRLTLLMEMVGLSSGINSTSIAGILDFVDIIKT